MNVLIQLSHPAHFHLYKIVAQNLMADGHQVVFVIKSKDILEELLQNAGLPYVNINQHAHRGSKLGILWDMLVREWRIARLCRKYKIDLLTGSTPEVAHVAKWTGRRSVNTGEDDADVISMFIKIAKPFIDGYAAPDPCEMGSVESRTTHYPGYHELAYLHPNHFEANAEVVKGYGMDIRVNGEEVNGERVTVNGEQNPFAPYFILRFASLNAHHDSGIKGINTEVASRLIEILKPHGRIYITSERPLEPQFEQYRIKINPLDMHHVMAFASLYIGDSQTMAAEAGVLGVPFVRFNDFVGRIGYLRELEDVYQLGSGIHATPLPADSPIRKADGSTQPSGVEALYEVVERLVEHKGERLSVSGEREHFDALRSEWAKRRERMLREKIDCAKFLTWFIEQYPVSVEEVKQAGESFWEKFK